VILVPLGIVFAIKLIPSAIWEDCRSRAATMLDTRLPRSRTAAVVIVVIWLIAAAWLGSMAWKFMTCP
jgi:hypothetical protein